MHWGKQEMCTEFVCKEKGHFEDVNVDKFSSVLSAKVV
jgi:hypothetical protein